MATYFRLVQARWAASAMTGEGARIAGGRWNPPGLPAVYLAGSRALAALEIVVHAPREVLPLEWRLFEVEVPEEMIETASPRRLPGDWQTLPSSTGARRFGEAWLRAGVALALKLPSVIIPEEPVLLVNPQHPDAARLRVSKANCFHFDPRL
jgi:RES domain-containing protein